MTDEAAHMDKPMLIGVFTYLDEIVGALKALRDRGLEIHKVYSPVPSHHIRDAMGLKPSMVRYFTLFGGILGVVVGIGLVVYTSLQWKFIVGGKPVVPKVPTVIVAFEFCILLSILFNLLGLMTTTRLPKLSLPVYYDPAFTQDRFGVLVVCREGETQEVAEMLKEAGAEEVHEYRE